MMLLRIGPMLLAMIVLAALEIRRLACQRT